MDLVAIVTLLGIVQGFFMGVLLILSKGPNRRVNRFLGTLFICYALSILHFFLDRSGLYGQVHTSCESVFRSCFSLDRCAFSM